MRLGRGLLLLAALAWFATPCPAGCQSVAEARSEEDQEQDEDLSEILEGFGDEVVMGTQEGTARQRSGPLRLGGRLKLGLSYAFAHDPPAPGRTDWRGLSRLRPELFLETEADPGGRWRLFLSGRAFTDLAYPIHGRERYTEQVLERHQHELELRDTYLAVRLGRRLDLTVGRQIVAWGNSENVRVTDLLNPLDLREPGVADIEDLRLPLAMTRLDLLAGRWSLSGIAVHEIRFDQTPAFGHDFFAAAVPLPPELEPATTLATTELGLAARGTFAGWDLSLYLARVFDDRPHLTLDPTAGLALKHSRLQMLGAAWDLAAGNYLLKAEAAHLRGLEFFSLPGRQLARSDLMLGVEYAGWSETSITLEVVDRHLHGHEPVLQLSPDLVCEDELDWVLRASRTFLHQTLTVTLLGMRMGATGEDGALTRLEGRYDLSDTVEVTAGVVLYSSGTRYGFSGIGGNDRLFAEVVYRF